MEPLSGDSAACLSRYFQVKTFYGFLCDLLRPAPGRGDSHLSPSQRERAGDPEGQREGVAAD